MIPSPLDAVIFDMDGTLLDTERAGRSAAFAACTLQGHAMTPDFWLGLIGSPREVNDARILGHFGDAFDIATYHRDSASQLDRLLASGDPLRPGALMLLDHLRDAGIPIGLATSTAAPKVARLLERAGIAGYFGAIVTRDDVTHGKPHPESYLLAAEQLGARPSHCLALEDSHIGVRAAAAAGMATIMVPDMLASTPEMEQLCAAILPSLTDVLARIRA